MDFYEKVKGLLLEPSMTFDVLKEEPLEGAIKYYVGIAAVYSAIFALMLGFAGSFFGSMMGFGNLGMMMGAGVGIGAAITFFVVFMIMAIAGAFIGGAILHIFVYYCSDMVTGYGDHWDTPAARTHDWKSYTCHGFTPDNNLHSDYGSRCIVSHRFWHH